MARNRIVINAPAAHVWQVLADARSYDKWVVGAKRIRDVDPGWPAPGARLHHTVGVGAFALKDTTAVLERRENELLVLKAHARPAGVAKVTFRLQPEGGRTHVVMEEQAVSSLAALLWRPVLDAATHMRNERCLQRLKRLVEDRR